MDNICCPSCGNVKCAPISGTDQISCQDCGKTFNKADGQTAATLNAQMGNFFK